MYEPSERFRSGGLRETPWWRWVLYVVIFGFPVCFLGFKYDSSLFYTAPIGAAFLVAVFAGVHRAVNTPRSRAWIFRNLWWMALLPLLGRIAIFMWDQVDERREREKVVATASLSSLLASEVLFSSALPSSQITVITNGFAPRWVPTARQIREGEKAAIDYLRQLDVTDERSAYVKRQADRILAGYPDYRLQVVGRFHRDTNRRYVLFNYIPMPWEVEPGVYNDQFPDWKTNCVFVMDGGINFWQIEYDAETGLCRNLHINFEV